MIITGIILKVHIIHQTTKNESKTKRKFEGLS